MGVFDDHRVTQANAYGIQFINDDEGGGVGVTVGLGVSSNDGDELGPSVSVEIYLPTAKGASLAEIQEEATDRALVLLERIVKEDRGAVKKLLYVPPEFQFQRG